MAIKGCVGIRVGASTLTMAVSRFTDVVERANVVASDSGDRTTPAVVGFVNGEWVLGEAAKQQEVKNPKNTFKKLLRLAVQAEAAKVQPMDAASGDPAAPAVGADALLTKLLKRLKEMAEESAGGGKVSPCVISVPADLSEAQRAVVAGAGAAAGLDVLQVLSEPVAAALAHGADAPSPDSGARASRWVVVDLGGSSLSVTALTVHRGAIAVAAHETTSDISGAGLVERLALFGAKAFSRKVGEDPLESRKSAARLRAGCEGTLRFLSNAPQADIEVESLLDGVDLRQRVSRARFEDLAADLWPHLSTAVTKALAAAGFEKESVDRVVLAGGASRVPKVAAILASCFSAQALKDAAAVPPDEAAAVGCARQAARLVCGPSGADPLAAADYKKSKEKLHKRLPGHAELPALATGLSLAAGGWAQALLPAGCPLPVAKHTVALDHGGQLAVGADGLLALELMEEGDDAPLATLPIGGLAAGAAPPLTAAVEVSAAGEVTLKVSAGGAGEVTVTIPPP